MACNLFHPGLGNEMISLNWDFDSSVEIVFSSVNQWRQSAGSHARHLNEKRQKPRAGTLLKERFP